MSRTKPCECGKQMILEPTGKALLVDPPMQQQNWRCFGCGAIKSGPVLKSKTQEQLSRELWEQEQDDH